MSAVASRTRRRLLTYELAAAGIFLGAVTLSVVLFVYARGWERQSITTELDLRARQRVEVVQSKVLRSMEVLHGAGAFIETRHQVSRREFGLFVKGALERQPELHALAWTPRITRLQRAEYEARARADGLKDFSLNVRDASGGIVPAPESDEYYPVYYIEPDDRNRTAIGFDLASNPVRRQALLDAQRTGSPAATSPVRLVQDNGPHLGFVVYVAVYDSQGVAQKQLAGFCSAVFSVDELLGASATGLDAEGLEFTLSDGSPGDQPLIHRDADGPVADLSASAPLDVGGQRWFITLRPTARFVAAHSNGHAVTILSTGIIISVLLTAYIRRAMKQKVAVEQRVRERTSELSREVAERRRAEDAARLAEANYREIFENSVEGIFQTTPDGHYLHANRALARIYGYDTPAHLIAHLADIAEQLYVRPGRREEFIEQVQTHGIVSDFESQIRRRDGAIIWISENARAVRDAAGRVLYYEGMVVNITPRKQAEEALQRNREELEERVNMRTAELAQSNEALQLEIAVRQRAEDAAAGASRAKSEFLASISHEIRTPMNAILGYAQLLHRDASLRGSQRDAIETIMNSGRHLTELIDDVLDISKIEAGRAELAVVDVDLRALVVGIAGMFRQKCEQKAIAFKVECDAELPSRVRADERKLRQVLINLLGNAVKFTHQGSVKLWIGVMVDEAGQHCCQFEVCDTGDGIPADAQEKIFEPFRQGSAGHRWGGTGLGLAIAQRLVEVMGGRLQLQSAIGAGSRFHFTLVLAAGGNEAFESSRPEVEALAPGHRVRALVVDDMLENRQVLARMLADVGCEATAASSGEEALWIMSQREFDIVFLDVLMPDMDGTQTARRIRDLRGAAADGTVNGGLNGAVRLVATSASAFTHEQEEFRAAGFEEVVSKPVRCDRLYACLSNLLGVEFTYVARDEDPDVEPLAPKVLALPPDLRQRLSEAAELYSVTEIRQCIEEVERCGPAALALGQFLRKCVHHYDMGGILRLVAGEKEMKDAALLCADA